MLPAAQRSANHFVARPCDVVLISTLTNAVGCKHPLLPLTPRIRKLPETVDTAAPSKGTAVSNHGALRHYHLSGAGARATSEEVSAKSTLLPANEKNTKPKSKTHTVSKTANQKHELNNEKK